MDRTQRILDGRNRLKTSQLEGRKSSDHDVLCRWRCRESVEMGFRRNLSRRFLNISRFLVPVMIGSLPIDASRGLRVGFVADKVAKELSELVVCCIVMSFGRQGVVCSCGKVY